MPLPSLGALTALVAWGTLVGVDLVSVPQAMLSRPLVAGAVAGALAGDVLAGLQVGVTLELYALDVLPVGASRYPDYGPATVAAAAGAAMTPQLPFGAAVLLGLGLASLGGWTLPELRKRTARRIAAEGEALAAGDAGAVGRVQWAGLRNDLLRSAALTLGGLLLVPLARPLAALDLATTQALGSVVVGAGIAAALGGAARSAGTGTRRTWLALGVAVGCALAWVWR